MICYRSISIFRKSISEMLKVKRGVYSDVEKEIKSAFKDKTITEIRNNRDVILYRDDSIVIKLRIQDNKNRLSKANGYRLLYLVHKEFEDVIFLEIYPKRGPLQKIDLNKNEYNNIYNCLNREEAEGMLQDYNFK